MLRPRARATPDLRSWYHFRLELLDREMLVPAAKSLMIVSVLRLQRAGYFYLGPLDSMVLLVNAGVQSRQENDWVDKEPKTDRMATFGDRRGAISMKQTTNIIRSMKQTTIIAVSMKQTTSNTRSGADIDTAETGYRHLLPVHE
jgi:hypothetical protein